MWGLGLENSRWHEILLLLLWCWGSRQGGCGEVFRVLDEREGSRITGNWGRGQRSLPDESQCAVRVRCVLTHAWRKLGDLAATVVGTHPPSTLYPTVGQSCVCAHAWRTSPLNREVHAHTDHLALPIHHPLTSTRVHVHTYPSHTQQTTSSPHPHLLRRRQRHCKFIAPTWCSLTDVTAGGNATNSLPH